MDVETNGSPNSSNFRQLEEEHRRYSEKLENLMQKPYLSADEQIEEVRLKKLKLQIKDQMMGHRSPGHPQYVA